MGGGELGCGVRGVQIEFTVTSARTAAGAHTDEVLLRGGGAHLGQ